MSGQIVLRSNWNSMGKCYCRLMYLLHLYVRVTVLRMGSIQFAQVAYHSIPKNEKINAIYDMNLSGIDRRWMYVFFLIPLMHKANTSCLYKWLINSSKHLLMESISLWTKCWPSPVDKTLQVMSWGNVHSHKILTIQQGEPSCLSIWSNMVWKWRKDKICLVL